MGTTPDRQYGRELATESEVTQRLADHRDRTLLHELDRSAALDIVRDANGRVQFVRHRDGAGGALIRETEIARDAGGRALSITERQFEPPGTLARTRSLSIARGLDGKVASGILTAS
jgi:hypothetical protein